jgi:hypothetical protein
MNDVDRSSPRSDGDAVATAVNAHSAGRPHQRSWTGPCFSWTCWKFVRIDARGFRRRGGSPLVGGVAFISEPEADTEALPGSACGKERFAAAVRAGWDAEPRVDYTKEQVTAVVMGLEDASALPRSRPGPGGTPRVRSHRLPAAVSLVHPDGVGESNL